MLGSRPHPARRSRQPVPPRQGTVAPAHDRLAEGRDGHQPGRLARRQRPSEDAPAPASQPRSGALQRHRARA